MTKLLFLLLFVGAVANEVARGPSEPPLLIDNEQQPVLDGAH